jgi:hypothetical protein
MADDKNGQDQFERARRQRNLAIAIALGGVVLLFFIMTMVRVGGHVEEFFK